MPFRRFTAARSCPPYGRRQSAASRAGWAMTRQLVPHSASRPGRREPARTLCDRRGGASPVAPTTRSGTRREQERAGGTLPVSATSRAVRAGTGSAARAKSPASGEKASADGGR